MVKQAWDWLIANKEWFLSGLGLALVGLLVWLSKSIMRGIRAILRRPSLEPPAECAPEKKPLSLEDTMDKTHILFIDDDVRFKVVSILQTAGWKHTAIVKDIVSLGEDSVKRSSILFVDINGVGKKLGFKDEGLGLAFALKTRYPEKKVIIYSADTKAERFHDAWKQADTYLAKNADPYEFQQIVEEYATELNS
jgi:hypothetical protein